MQMRINKAFLPLVGYRGRYVLLWGGAGAGKSVAAAQMALLRALRTPGLRLMIVRKTHRTVRQSQYRLLRDLLTDLGLPYESHETLMEIRLPNGSEIISAGLNDDREREKIKSLANVHGIWVEEATELDEQDLRQLDLRLRGESPDGYHQITCTFNPVSRDHWIKAWTERDDVLAIHTTYRDNAFLDDVYREVLESMRDRDPRLYEVYCLGQWGRPAEGLLFRRAWYQEWHHLPEDARGVIYCDPNLSRRGQGDSTAIVKLLYAPSTGAYYVADAVCRSFSRSDDLLRQVLRMRCPRTLAIGFDGHVSQESTWSDHVRGYCRIEGIAYPRIEYCRYRVDELAKNLQLVMSDGLLFFPSGFASTPDGARFLEQLWAFEGKRAGRADDAPDALICALEFIAGRRLGRPLRPDSVKAITDHYALP